METKKDEYSGSKTMIPEVFILNIYDIHHRFKLVTDEVISKTYDAKHI